LHCADDDLLTALVVPHEPSPPKRLKASVQPTCKEPVGGRHINGTIDSGCTGHVTPNPHWLINHRPCADTFRAAAGTKHVATIIGDMPVIARDRLGGYHHKLITNVRCVSGMWKFGMGQVAACGADEDEIYFRSQHRPPPDTFFAVGKSSLAMGSTLVPGVSPGSSAAPGLGACRREA